MKADQLLLGASIIGGAVFMVQHDKADEVLFVYIYMYVQDSQCSLILILTHSV